ncbi:hypothetical protein L6164_037075 [Bauhinia variegata]|uniref:Uncharacterized protein n=1 Tax=Bauhinia variegata TaxID=167791 RepID=A0ACB9KJ50_BAUVA|nr:hypothetical protein L6164_037075 [Bauhinia variegata]
MVIKPEAIVKNDCNCGCCENPRENGENVFQVSFHGFHGSCFGCLCRIQRLNIQENMEKTSFKLAFVVLVLLLVGSVESDGISVVRVAKAEARVKSNYNCHQNSDCSAYQTCPPGIVPICFDCKCECFAL